jgi:hypothetical protein
MQYLSKLISIIVFLLNLFFIEATLATEYLTKAIIEKIEQKKGDVVLKGSKGFSAPVKINDEFKPNDYLETKIKASARLAFNENSRIFLGESSSLYFKPGSNLRDLVDCAKEGSVTTKAVAVKSIASTRPTTKKEATLRLDQGEMRIVTAQWTKAVPYCNPVTEAETSCGLITIQKPTPSSIPNIVEPERDASVVIIKHYNNEKGLPVTKVTALTDEDIKVCDRDTPPKCTNFLLGGQSVEIVDGRMGEIIEKDLRVFYRNNPHTIDSRKEVQQEQDQAIKDQEERFIKEDFLISALTGRERDWNSFDSFEGKDLLNNEQCNESVVTNNNGLQPDH